MKLVVGNKLKEISDVKFREIKNRYEKIEIDLGTGNGRYVFKKALLNPRTLYIGIDPAEKQLRQYSKKAVRKNLENVLFVLAGAEALPKSLNNCANRITIILPWGSLLDYTANFNPKVIEDIKKKIKKNGMLVILFGYNKEEEPTEVERLNLEKLNKEYLEKELIPQYRKLGFELEKIIKLKKEDLREFETSWSKKLSFGRPRTIFLLRMRNT